jgi:hypothetical protein
VTIILLLYDELPNLVIEKSFDYILSRYIS